MLKERVKFTEAQHQRLVHQATDMVSSRCLCVGLLYVTLFHGSVKFGFVTNNSYSCGIKLMEFANITTLTIMYLTLFIII